MLKYTTAYLYIQNQSLDDDVSELASTQWEYNCTVYEKRLEEIKSKLPESTLKFLDLMCLHDANFVATNLATNVFENEHFEAGSEVVLCTVQRDWGEDKYACNLTYKLSDTLKSKWHYDSGFHPEYPTIWLYDEFDVREDGKPIHSILFSSGLELEIPFEKFGWFKAPILLTHDFRM